MDGNYTPARRAHVLRKLLPFLTIEDNSSEAISAGLAAAVQDELSAPTFAVDEWTNPAAASAAGLHAAAASAATDQTYLAANLITATLAHARNLRFVVAGGTAAHAPTSALVTGTDINGDELTETVSITASAGTYDGVKAFKTITSIVLSGGTGTGATVSIGWGVKMGLSQPIKERAGRRAVIQEVAAGSVVTNGTFVAAATSPPNGTYAPNTAQDAANDYAVTYERTRA